MFCKKNLHCSFEKCTVDLNFMTAVKRRLKINLISALYINVLVCWDIVHLCFGAFFASIICLVLVNLEWM
jgi:hypothetical protein